jgi:hypothetical protein
MLRSQICVSFCLIVGKFQGSSSMINAINVMYSASTGWKLDIFKKGGVYVVLFHFISNVAGKYTICLEQTFIETGIYSYFQQVGIVRWCHVC